MGMDDQARTIRSSQYRAILGGIIASLIVLYFLDPILSFFGRLALRLAASLFTSYLNNLYSEVAVSEPNFGFTFIGIAAGISVGTTWTLLLFMSGIFNRLRRTDVQQSKSAKPGRLILFSLALTALMLSFLTVDSYIRLATTSTFRQRLALVAPYISEQQEKKIVSEYALMQNQADFKALMRAMEDIATRNGVTLPKNRLYPF